MARSEMKKLLGEVVDFQEQCIARARELSNEQLDTTYTVMRPSGPRELLLRNVLYNLVIHPREHAVHVGKILQKTGSPLGQPTESQAIVMKAKEAWGEFEAMLASLDDSDLDREYEGHSLRSVLLHLRDAHKSYLDSIEKGVEASHKVKA